MFEFKVKYNKFIILFYICILIFFCFPVFGNPDSIESKVDDYLAPYIQVGNFSGSVLIAYQGNILVNKGYGMANLEHNVPNNGKTIFRLGSLSKQFTATSIMQIQEKGLLSVNDLLIKYIPDYPNGDTITLHHLLTHTSGIKNFTELPEYATAQLLPTTLTQTIDMFKKQPLAFMPGTKISYSNSNFILLSFIIQKVSGLTYEQYIQKNIFGPLGMKNSGYDNPKTILKGRAAGYVLTDEGMVNAPYIDMSIPSGAGALYSTVEDLYLWDRALYTEKILKNESLQKMFTPASIGSAGYGFFIDQLFNHKEIYHSGSVNGFRTNIARFIDDDAVIIVLNNVLNGAVGKISTDLAAILFGANYEIPSFNTFDLNANKLSSYIGNYRTTSNGVLTVTQEADGLYAAANGLKKAKLYPTSETRFFQKVNSYTFTFNKDNLGKVQSVVISTGKSIIPGPFGEMSVATKVNSL
jgi:CubicO group peptidase (beta-lactamase class C family)